MLLERVVELAPPGTTRLELLTGAGSLRNQRLYKKAGFRLRGEAGPGVVRMSRPHGPR
jgi:tRNA (guanine37-N1)-methyltransferase